LPTIRYITKIKTPEGFDTLLPQTSSDQVRESVELPNIGTAAGASQETINAAIDSKINASGGGGGSLTIQQTTRLGVVASQAEPAVIELPITPDPTYKHLPIEILQLQSGGDNVNRTLLEFNNDDSNDFEPNEFISFDGALKLKTAYSFPMTDEGALGPGRLFSQVLNRADFKSIESLNAVVS
jgi:hypothetical protein